MAAISDSLSRWFAHLQSTDFNSDTVKISLHTGDPTERTLPGPSEWTNGGAAVIRQPIDPEDPLNDESPAQPEG